MSSIARASILTVVALLGAGCSSDSGSSARTTAASVAATTTSTTLAPQSTTPATTSTSTSTSTLPVEQFELVVAGGQSECEDVGPRTCLVVVQPGEPMWTNFYSHIEGFDFVEGTRSTVLVERTELPPEELEADGSAYRFRLIDVIGAEPEVEFPAPGDPVPTS